MLNQGFAGLVLELLKSRGGDADGQGVGLGFQVAGAFSQNAEHNLSHAGGYLLYSGTILGLLRRCGRYGRIRGLLHSLDAAPGPAFGIVLALSPQYICLHRLRRFDQSQQASGSCS
jgi:hypothetical protein